MFARSILAATAARRPAASVLTPAALLPSLSLASLMRPVSASTVSPLLASAALAFRYPAAATTGPSSAFPMGARFMSKFGSEYQPSIIRRKRKWGFLARSKSRLGRKILARRVLKGRKWLSH